MVYKHEQVWANIGKDLIWKTSELKLLGITVDKDLKFDRYVLKLNLEHLLKISHDDVINRPRFFVKRNKLIKTKPLCIK